MVALLSVDTISFRYGAATVLRGVSLAIARGEQLALIGRNGAGKSTLAKHLNGLLVPDAGKIILDGRDIKKMGAAGIARRIGYVFQNPDDQIFKRTVFDEVSFGVHVQGMRDKARIKAQVDKSLAMVGLTEAARLHPYDLSFARRKLVAIASILATDPEIFIFDEPTLGQSGHGLRILAELFAELRRTGKTVVIISHDVDFLLNHVDRFIVLDGGKIAADGSAADIFYDEQLCAKSSIIPPQLVQIARQLGAGRPVTSEAQFLSALLMLKKQPGCPGCRERMPQ